jgi:two-component system, NarL family, nitrate/nitrite response regulator NarL
VTRVIVIAEVRLYREGLREVLSRDPDTEVLGTAADWHNAAALIATARPNVVVLDAAVGPSGAEVRSTMASIGASVVVIGVTEEDREVAAWAEAGIAGYVSREQSLRDLIAAIRTAECGELLCSPRVAGALLRHVGALRRRVAADGPSGQLTAREVQIIDLIEQGLSNKEIAQRLWIEVPTVKNHVHHILAKLQVKRRGEAVARVRREGLLERQL